MELKEDKRKVEFVGGNIHITRTTTEIYEPGEFVRTIAQLEGQLTQQEEGMKAVNDILGDLKGHEKEAQRMHDEILAKGKKERDKAGRNGE